eukprot:213453-Rhodomonas_salina.4
MLRHVRYKATPGTHIDYAATKLPVLISDMLRPGKGCLVSGGTCVQCPTRLRAYYGMRGTNLAHMVLPQAKAETGPAGFVPVHRQYSAPLACEPLSSSLEGRGGGVEATEAGEAGGEGVT